VIHHVTQYHSERSIDYQNEATSQELGREPKSLVVCKSLGMCQDAQVTLCPVRQDAKRHHQVETGAAMSQTRSDETQDQGWCA
jgi:hypothetical protein